MSDHSPIEGLLNNYGDTTLTGLDVFKIGESVLNAVAATQILGHASPAEGLAYTHGTGHLWTDVSRDLVAWSSGREQQAPGCRERLLELVQDSGWTRLAMANVSERLKPA